MSEKEVKQARRVQQAKQATQAKKATQATHPKISLRRPVATSARPTAAAVFAYDSASAWAGLRLRWLLSWRRASMPSVEAVVKAAVASASGEPVAAAKVAAAAACARGCTERACAITPLCAERNRRPEDVDADEVASWISCVKSVRAYPTSTLELRYRRASPYATVAASYVHTLST